MCESLIAGSCFWYPGTAVRPSVGVRCVTLSPDLRSLCVVAEADDCPVAVLCFDTSTLANNAPVLAEVLLAWSV